MDECVNADFPIDWTEDQYVSRREFTKFLILSSGGMAVASIGAMVWARIPRQRRTFDRKFVARLDDVKVGGWMQFGYPRSEDTCILIRTGENSAVAYSRRCTHLSCPVIWEPDTGNIGCPCHNGVFSLIDGHVIAGPPVRPLPKIELSLQGGEVYALGVTNG